MQTRKAQWTLEPINNIMQDSTFGSSNVIPGPPIERNEFLLMTAQPFKLMDGQDFLLMTV